MSGCSYQTTCPICEEQMDAYSDHKPHDTVFGSCLNCGFSYYTATGQMGLKEINELRKEYNENAEPEEPLKPLKKADLDKYKDEIKNI